MEDTGKLSFHPDLSNLENPPLFQASLFLTLLTMMNVATAQVVWVRPDPYWKKWTASSRVSASSFVGNYSIKRPTSKIYCFPSERCCCPSGRLEVRQGLNKVRSNIFYLTLTGTLQGNCTEHRKGPFVNYWTLPIALANKERLLTGPYIVDLHNNGHKFKVVNTRQANCSYHAVRMATSSSSPICSGDNDRFLLTAALAAVAFFVHLDVS